MRLHITYEQALEAHPEHVNTVYRPGDKKWHWFYDVHIDGECWELLTAVDTKTLEIMTRKYLSENTKVKLSCRQGRDSYENRPEFVVPVPELLIAHYVKAFELLRECDGFEAMRAVWREGSRAVITAMRPYKNDPKFGKYNEHVNNSQEMK